MRRGSGGVGVEIGWSSGDAGDAGGCTIRVFFFLFCSPADRKCVRLPWARPRFWRRTNHSARAATGMCAKLHTGGAHPRNSQHEPAPRPARYLPAVFQWAISFRPFLATCCVSGVHLRWCAHLGTDCSRCVATCRCCRCSTIDLVGGDSAACAVWWLWLSPITHPTCVSEVFCGRVCIGRLVRLVYSVVLLRASLSQAAHHACSSLVR